MCAAQWLLELMATIVHHQHGPVAVSSEGKDGSSSSSSSGSSNGPDNAESGGVKEAGTGIGVTEAANMIAPLLLNFVDFRLAVHGTDHTVLDGLSASDSVLDFVKVSLLAPACARSYLISRSCALLTHTHTHARAPPLLCCCFAICGCQVLVEVRVDELRSGTKKVNGWRISC